MPVEFGATPWGKAWLRTIESPTATPNRLLPKARSLARNAAVTILSTAPGLIEANVVVKEVTHGVRIELPRWTGQALTDADALIGKSLADSPGVAPGDLPDELATELSRHLGLAVPLDQQGAECTCSARQAHCVHVLATHYALIQRIDEHPMLAIDLRSPVREAGPEPRPHPGIGTQGRTSPDWIALTDLTPKTFYSLRTVPPGTNNVPPA